MKLTKELSIYVKRRANLWVKAIRKWWAVQIANDEHRATGRQFMVVEYGNYFHVVDNRKRKAMNRRNQKFDRLTWKEMKENAVYTTK